MFKCGKTTNFRIELSDSDRMEHIKETFNNPVQVILNAPNKAELFPDPFLYLKLTCF